MIRLAGKSVPGVIVEQIAQRMTDGSANDW